MTVTIQDIQRAFDDLESDSRSREEIANYATAAMRADDSGLLVMEPRAEAAQIWKAITYLSGVDIKETPDTYLHCREDFTAYRAELGI